MKANSNKCHIFTSKKSCMNLKSGSMSIEGSTCEKLLGVKVDNKLNFNEHLNGITKKTSRKVTPYIRFFFTSTYEKTLFNEFILPFTILLLSSYLDVS